MSSQRSLPTSRAQRSSTKPTCRAGHGRGAGFDRMLFRGYPPIMSGAAMAQLLQSEHVTCTDLKQFLLATSQRLKCHAQWMSEAAGRPFEYVTSADLRMERRAREPTERDAITEGVVCVFSKLEPCRTFPSSTREGMRT